MDEKGDNKQYQIRQDVNGDKIAQIMKLARERTFYDENDVGAAFEIIIEAIKTKKAKLLFESDGSNIYTFTMQIAGKHQLQLQIREIRTKKD